MNNILDLLLKEDVSKIKKPTKKVEIKRLSKVFGQKIIFTCEGLDSNQLQYINESSENDGEQDIAQMRRLTVIEGVKDPSLKSKELCEKFKAVTPNELLKDDKFLLPGEILSLYRVVSDLTGFNDDAVAEIKNE
jgi:hypothetical protein